MVQKLWHKTQMRQKRVGPLQSSEFSPLVFIPLWIQHKKMEEKRINIIKYVSRYIIACLIEKPNFFTVEVRCRHEISLEISNDIWFFNWEASKINPHTIACLANGRGKLHNCAFLLDFLQYHYKLLFSNFANWEPLNS